jgi:hypothetical protein
MLVSILISGAILGGAYLAVFWNTSNGIISEPAQAIRSVINPGERDYESNLYRDIETQNLQFTISTSPIMGIGFGRQFIVIRPLVDLTATWPFQLYMPHNNMLWIWMRTGIVGFMSFWAIVGLAILLAIASIRLGAARLRLLLADERGEAEPEASRKGPHIVQAQKQECAEYLVMTFLAQTVLISLLALAQVDQGLMSFRLMMFAGIAFGTLAATWNMYNVKYRLPQGVDLGVLPELEKKPRTRRRVRLLPGVS